jgi:hypothetical protein
MVMVAEGRIVSLRTSLRAPALLNFKIGPSDQKYIFEIQKENNNPYKQQ